MYYRTQMNRPHKLFTSREDEKLKWWFDRFRQKRVVAPLILNAPTCRARYCRKASEESQ